MPLLLINTFAHDFNIRQINKFKEKMNARKELQLKNAFSSLQPSSDVVRSLSIKIVTELTKAPNFAQL